MTTNSTNISVATLVDSDQQSVTDLLVPLTTETINGSSVVSNANTITEPSNSGFLYPDWVMYATSLLQESAYSGSTTIFPYKFSLGDAEDLGFLRFDWRGGRVGHAIISVSGASLHHTSAPFMNEASSWELEADINTMILPYGYVYLAPDALPTAIISGTITEIVFGTHVPPAAINSMTGLGGVITLTGGFYPTDGNILESLNYSVSASAVKTIDLDDIATTFLPTMGPELPNIASNIINPTLATTVGVDTAYTPGRVNPITLGYNFDNVFRQLLIKPTSETPFTINISIVNEYNQIVSNNTYTSSTIGPRNIPDPFAMPSLAAGDFITTPGVPTHGVVFNGANRAHGTDMTDYASVTLYVASYSVLNSDMTRTYLASGVIISGGYVKGVGTCGAGMPESGHALFIGGKNATAYIQGIWKVTAATNDISNVVITLPMSMLGAAAAGCGTSMVCYGGNYGSADGAGLSPTTINIVNSTPVTGFAQYSQLNDTTNSTGIMLKCDTQGILSIKDYTASGRRKNSTGVGNFTNLLPVAAATDSRCHFTGGNNGSECIPIDNYTVADKNLDILALNKSMTRPQNELVGTSLINRAIYMSSDKVDRGPSTSGRECLFSVVDITGTRLVATSFLNRFGVTNPTSMGLAFGFGSRGVFMTQANVSFKAFAYVVDGDGNWTDVSTYLQTINGVGTASQFGKFTAYASF